jgi:DNA-binding response OmpR family regulator
MLIAGSHFMNAKILVIDDDQKLNHLLTNYLARFGFQVQAHTHPREGLEALARFAPDLIILDIMLPDMDGFDVCRSIRRTHSIPIIMLTARGEVTDRIVGLEIGADDYLAKPFEPRELVARIQTILRRVRQESPSRVRRVGDLMVDLEKRRVQLDQAEITLTSAEFEVLALLTRRPGVVYSRDQIMEQLWDIQDDGESRSIDILISRLRQKLHDSARAPRLIKTVWGVGYVYVGGEPSPWD